MNQRKMAEALGLELPKSMPDSEVGKIVKGHQEHLKQLEKQRQMRQKEDPTHRKLKALVAQYVSSTFEKEKEHTARAIYNLAKGYALKVRSIAPEAADYPKIDFDLSKQNPTKIKEEEKSKSVPGKVLKRWSVIGGTDYVEEWIDKDMRTLPAKVRKWRACGLRVKEDILEDLTEEEESKTPGFDDFDTSELSDEYILDRIEELNNKITNGSVKTEEITELGKLTFEKFQRKLNTLPPKKAASPRKKATRSSKFGQKPRRQRILELGREGLYNRNEMAEILVDEGYGTLKASLAAINGTLYDEKRKGGIHHWRTRDDKVIEVFDSEKEWKNRTVK